MKVGSLLRYSTTLSSQCARVKCTIQVRFLLFVCLFSPCEVEVHWDSQECGAGASWLVGSWIQGLADWPPCSAQNAHTQRPALDLLLPSCEFGYRLELAPQGSRVLCSTQDRSYRPELFSLGMLSILRPKHIFHDSPT